MGKNQFMMGFVMANLRGGENHQNYTVGGSKPLFKVSALYWSTTPPTQKCAELKRLLFMQFIKVLIFTDLLSGHRASFSQPQVAFCANN